MKVVFDSNIYVFAFAIPGGLAGRALDAAIDGSFGLAISKPILNEVLGVLARKFARDAEEISRIALFMSYLAETVAPARRVHVLADEPGNRILECAIAARVDLVVTGDRGMHALGAFEGVSIVSLRQFLEALDAPGAVHQPRVAYGATRRKMKGLSGRGGAARPGTG